MDETPTPQPEQPVTNLVKNTEQHKLPRIIIERDWKDYLGESVLIIFSVLLALILTEIINKFHEHQQTKEVIAGLSGELSQNGQWETEQYAYHLQVLKNIDSALNYTGFQKIFLADGLVNFDAIAPRGVLLHDLNDVAWQAAKQDHIIAKISNLDYHLLSSIYDNQERFHNLEQGIGAVILSRDARTAPDNRITLILLRDNYRAWAIGRAPNLLKDYKRAIQMLEKYQ